MWAPYYSVLQVILGKFRDAGLNWLNWCRTCAISDWIPTVLLVEPPTNQPAALESIARSKDSSFLDVSNCSNLCFFPFQIDDDGQHLMFMYIHVLYIIICSRGAAQSYIVHIHFSCSTSPFLSYCLFWCANWSALKPTAVLFQRAPAAGHGLPWSSRSSWWGRPDVASDVLRASCHKWLGGTGIC